MFVIRHHMLSVWIFKSLHNNSPKSSIIYCVYHPLWTFKLEIIIYLIFFRISNFLFQDRIQDFKLGGAHLKKMRRAKGGAKILGYFVWKIIFFSIAEGRAKFLGYFVWKITILHQKILFFPILGEGRGPGAPPPWIRPCIQQRYQKRVRILTLGESGYSRRDTW